MNPRGERTLGEWMRANPIGGFLVGLLLLASECGMWFGLGMMLGAALALMGV